MMNISIKQFRAFLALYKYKNFTRAAQSVFLSQPAFSTLIFSLEKEIGLSLFYRDTKSVRLTADGEMFYKIANNVMDVFNHSIENLKNYTESQQRQVNIATLPSIAAQWLPQITEQFRIKYPDIHFDIKDMQTSNCIDLIKEGVIDLAICGVNMNEPGIETIKLFSDHYYVVFNINHPLAKKENITLDDVQNSKLIKFAKTTSIYQSLYENLTLDNDDYIEVKQLSTLFGLLLSNQGITLLPELTLYLFRHNDIIIKPVLWNDLKRDIYLIKHKDKMLTKSSAFFINFILDSLNIENTFKKYN